MAAAAAGAVRPTSELMVVVRDALTATGRTAVEQTNIREAMIKYINGTVEVLGIQQADLNNDAALFGELQAKLDQIRGGTAFTKATAISIMRDIIPVGAQPRPPAAPMTAADHEIADQLAAAQAGGPVSGDVVIPGQGGGRRRRTHRRSHRHRKSHRRAHRHAHRRHRKTRRHH
jgi:hypothetical protein